MITKITIECETVDQLLLHLTVIKKQIIKVAKNDNLHRSLFGFQHPTKLQDSNCYGEHVVTIKPE